MEIIFWQDKGTGKIDPALFNQQAEDMAKGLAEDLNKSRRKDVNKQTQLRRFYDEVLRLDAETKTAGREKWDFILPQVHMLVSKAAYAKGREKISDRFLTFIKSSVNQIEDPKDLSVFASFFEAVMGFYKLHGPRN